MERMGSTTESEQPPAHIISVRLERDETASGQPITLDRAVVSFSLDGVTVQSATFRWDRRGDDIDSPDVAYPSLLWTELHDAALAELTEENRHAAARRAYERACAWERTRRDPDRISTVRIERKTLAEVAAEWRREQAERTGGAL